MFLNYFPYKKYSRLIMNTKDINIVGQYSRYSMKKVMKIEKKDNVRREHDDDRGDLFYDRQMQMIELQSLFEKKEENKKRLLERELEKKINSYKQQDRKKCIFDAERFVTLPQLLIALKTAELKCAYCSDEVKILYKYRLDQSQWTIDRIDNNKGHNHDNYVIACLKCNLKKGRTSHDKFDFTKKLVIVKND